MRDHSALPHFPRGLASAVHTGRGQESHSRLKRGESMDGKVKPVPLYGRRPSLDPQRDERRRRADGASRAARQPSRLSTSLLGRLLAADCSSVHRARSFVDRPQAPPKMVCVQREAAARGGKLTAHSRIVHRPRSRHVKGNNRPYSEASGGVGDSTEAHAAAGTRRCVRNEKPQVFRDSGKNGGVRELVSRVIT